MDSSWRPCMSSRVSRLLPHPRRPWPHMPAPDRSTERCLLMRPQTSGGRALATPSGLSSGARNCQRPSQAPWTS